MDGGGDHGSRDAALLLVIVWWVVMKRGNGISPKRQSTVVFMIHEMDRFYSRNTNQ